MPGSQYNEPGFGSVFFWKLGYNPSLAPLIGFLAIMEPKLWLKNPIFDRNPKVARKVWLVLSGQILAFHNSATGVVLWIKKIVLVFGFLTNDVMMGYVLCSFDDVICEYNEPISWLKVLLDARL